MTNDQLTQIISQIQHLIDENDALRNVAEHQQEMYEHYGDGLQDALDIINKVMGVKAK